MLFSRQLLNGSQDFFLFNTLIFICFFRYKTIETYARAFLTLIILAIGTVERKLASLNPPAQEDTIREELSIENVHACEYWPC